VLQFIEEPLESERDTLILVVALCRHLVYCLRSIHRHTYYATYTVWVLYSTYVIVQRTVQY
jgi:hypothetical protein